MQKGLSPDRHTPSKNPDRPGIDQDYVSSVIVAMRALSWGWDIDRYNDHRYEQGCRLILSHANGQWSREHYLSLVASGELLRVVMAAHDPRLPREVLLLVIKGFWSFWRQGLPVDTVVRMAAHPELDAELQSRLFGVYGGNAGLDSIRLAQALVDRDDCSLEVLRACCERYEPGGLNPNAVRRLIESCALHPNADYGLLMELMLHPEEGVRQRAAGRLEADDLLLALTL